MVLRFAANLTTMYTEFAPLDRFAAAAEDGFGAVEVLFPWDFGSAEAVATAREAAGIACLLIDTPVGDWAAGERGFLCLPDRKADFASGLDRTIEYCDALGATMAHCIAGVIPVDAERGPYLSTAIDNLRLAADRFQPHNIAALVEPINDKDTPGFFISTTAQALELLDAAAHPNTALQYDVYHVVMKSEPVVARFKELVDRIAHVQFSDAPGRGEPGTGQISFRAVFEAIAESGYEGWVAAEYKPSTGRTRDSLGWMTAFQD